MISGDKSLGCHVGINPQGWQCQVSHLWWVFVIDMVFGVASSNGIFGVSYWKVTLTAIISGSGDKSLGCHVGINPQGWQCRVSHLWWVFVIEMVFGVASSNGIFGVTYCKMTLTAIINDSGDTPLGCHVGINPQGWQCQVSHLWWVFVIEMVFGVASSNGIFGVTYCKMTLTAIINDFWWQVSWVPCRHQSTRVTVSGESFVMSLCHWNGFWSDIFKLYFWCDIFQIGIDSHHKWICWQVSCVPHRHQSTRVTVSGKSFVMGQVIVTKKVKCHHMLMTSHILSTIWLLKRSIILGFDWKLSHTWKVTLTLSSKGTICQHILIKFNLIGTCLIG